MNTINNQQSNILVIDDEPDILILLSDLLADEGYGITTASDGKEALELFKPESFDLVITDVRMPVMDGMEVMSRVKDMDEDIEVIILTGYADLENAVQSLRVDGAFDYLSKPLEDIDKLVNTVRQALEKRMLKLENRKKTAQLLKANEDLKIAELEKAALLNSISDMVVYQNPDHRIIWANRAASETAGFAPDQMVGRYCYEVLCKRSKPCEICSAEKTNESGKMQEGEIEGPGQRVWFNRCYPVSDETGNISGIVVLTQDITEKRRMEVELMKTRKLESIGILAGGIAHDYNNLLTAIMGNIFLAKSYFKSYDKVFELLNEAEKASTSAKDLTQKLITFSKGGTLIKKTISISKLVKDAVELALSGSNMKYEFFIPDNLWPVEIDEAQIGQVIHLLVINAKEAMPQGGTITIDSEGVSLSKENLFGLKAGEYVKVSIQDTGVGIPEKDMDRIFDPYFSTKEMGIQKGMGLGLSISHSIIKNHGGVILAESEAGIGTTIYFYLPVDKKSSVEEKHAKQPVKEKIIKGKGKILVMDDEKMVRDIAGNMLDRFGYDVKFSADGSEAIEMYKNAMDAGEPFVAVIMDLTIRDGMGGREAIGKLRKIDPNVKGIVSSGYSNDPVMTDYKAHGFSEALNKPFDMKELSELMQKIIPDD